MISSSRIKGLSMSKLSQPVESGLTIEQAITSRGIDLRDISNLSISAINRNGSLRYVRYLDDDYDLRSRFLRVYKNTKGEIDYFEAEIFFIVNRVRHSIKFSLTELLI